MLPTQPRHHALICLTAIRVYTHYPSRDTSQTIARWLAQAKKEIAKRSRANKLAHSATQARKETVRKAKPLLANDLRDLIGGLDRQQSSPWKGATDEGQVVALQAEL
jgi:hypothetical protein